MCTGQAQGRLIRKIPPKMSYQFKKNPFIPKIKKIYIFEKFFYFYFVWHWGHIEAVSWAAYTPFFSPVTVVIGHQGQNSTLDKESTDSLGGCCSGFRATFFHFRREGCVWAGLRFIRFHQSSLVKKKKKKKKWSPRQRWASNCSIREGGGGGANFFFFKKHTVYSECIVKCVCRQVLFKLYFHM